MSILRSGVGPMSARDIIDSWIGLGARYTYRTASNRKSERVAALKNPPSARTIGLLLRSMPGVARDISGRYYVTGRDKKVNE